MDEGPSYIYIYIYIYSLFPCQSIILVKRLTVACVAVITAICSSFLPYIYVSITCVTTKHVAEFVNIFSKMFFSW